MHRDDRLRDVPLDATIRRFKMLLSNYVGFNSGNLVGIKGGNIWSTRIRVESIQGKTRSG